MLLIYAVSFGHQIIPHHHHAINSNHNHTNANTHNHCITEKDSHSHVAHNDHFDEGVIDYLACVLGNHEDHPKDECVVLNTPNDQKNNAKNPTNLKEGLFFSVNQLAAYKTETILIFPLYFSNLCLNLVAQKKAKRGPPAV